jgi:hypothetical protein
MLLIAGSYALAGLDGSTTVVVSSLVSLLWVGLNEEVYSRGLVHPGGPKPEGVPYACATGDVRSG